MEKNFDLLGDPIPENFGKRGRPQHIPTERNRNKIRLLLALGWVNRRIAGALRVTGKTLTKHYFRELRHRDEARPALEAEHATLVYEAARGGNVGAMKELGRIIEKLNLDRPQPPKGRPAKPEKLGKKAAAERQAKEVDPDSGWAPLIH